MFREKFADWPEPGRIIKMKGHESSGEVIKVCIDVSPAFCTLMLDAFLCKEHSSLECRIVIISPLRSSKKILETA